VILRLTINDHFSETVAWFVTKLTRRVSLEEQELSILPGQLLFCGVHVAQSLVFCSVLDAIV
jgi:hypothetical protein